MPAQEADVESPPANSSTHGRFAMFSPRNMHLPHLPHLPHPHFSAPHFHMPNLGGTAEEGTKATGLHFIGQFLRARHMIQHRVMAKERARADKASEAHMVAQFEEEQARSAVNKPLGSPLRRFSSTPSPPLPPLWGELSEDMADLPPPAASQPPPPESSKPKVGAAAEADSKKSNDSEKFTAPPSGKQTIKLRTRDLRGGFGALLVCLIAVFLPLVWRPAHRRTDIHRTKLSRFGVYISSPEYAVSANEPLVLGGVPGAPLAPHSAHAMLDLKMILPCTSLSSACVNPTSATSHRRRALMADPRRGEAHAAAFEREDELSHVRALAASSSSSASASSGQLNATMKWELWRGEPGSVGAKLVLMESIALQPYAETEALKTIVPADYGVSDSSDGDLFLRVLACDSDGVAHPHPLLLEVTQLNAFGSWRVLFAGLLFLLIFFLVLSEVINRVYSTMAGAILVTGLNTLVYGHTAELGDAFGHVDWATLLLLFSMMILVDLLSVTGFFEWCAVRVAAAARGSATTVFIMLSLLAGFLSAFLDNVTCVMLFGPVTISLCKQMNVPSVPFYLTITLCATIGGTATLVGDPPNVVISQRLGVGFVDYLAYNGPLVFVMLPVAVAVQFYRFRPMLKTSTTLDAKAIERLRAEHPIVDERSLLYVGICLCTLFLALFLTEVTHVEPAFSCFLMMVIACLLVSRHSIRHLLEAVEWDTLLFFACLFIIVEGLVELGLIRAIGQTLSEVIKLVPIESRLTVACLLFLWVSALGSAFFESLPYTATIAAVLKNMDPVTLGISTRPLLWALSVGACVGGIGSIMGSSANLVALAVSNRYSPDEAIAGHHYLKYGLPLNFLLMAIASIYHYVLFSVMNLSGTLSGA